MEWIDYKKVFDSVPHSWIIKSLQLIGINNEIITFSRKATNYCKTSTCLHTEGKIIETEGIETQHEIFGAGTLSPLLFFISLIPLTEQMNKLNTRYEEHITTKKVSHLLYMDDWKLKGTTKDELQKQI